MRGGVGSEGRADAIYLWPNGLRWSFLGFALFFVLLVVPTLCLRLPSLWYCFGISLAVLVWMVWLYPFFVFYLSRHEVLSDLWGTWPPQMDKLYIRAPTLVTKFSLEELCRILLTHDKRSLRRLLREVLLPYGKRILRRLRALLPYDKRSLRRLLREVLLPYGKRILRRLRALLPYDKRSLRRLLREVLLPYGKRILQRLLTAFLPGGRGYRSVVDGESAQAQLERVALTEYFASKSSSDDIWCNRGFLRWLFTRCGPVVAGQGAMLGLLILASFLSLPKEAILPILMWSVVWTGIAAGFLWHATCALERECRVSLPPEDRSRLPYLGPAVVKSSLQQTLPRLTVPLVIAVAGINLTFAIPLIGVVGSGSGSGTP